MGNGAPAGAVQNTESENRPTGTRAPSIEAYGQNVPFETLLPKGGPEVIASETAPDAPTKLVPKRFLLDLPDELIHHIMSLCLPDVREIQARPGSKLDTYEEFEDFMSECNCSKCHQGRLRRLIYRKGAWRNDGDLCYPQVLLGNKRMARIGEEIMYRNRKFEIIINHRMRTRKDPWTHEHSNASPVLIGASLFFQEDPDHDSPVLERSIPQGIQEIELKLGAPDYMWGILAKQQWSTIFWETIHRIRNLKNLRSLRVWFNMSRTPVGLRVDPRALDDLWRRPYTNIRELKLGVFSVTYLCRCCNLSGWWDVSRCRRADMVGFLRRLVRRVQREVSHEERTNVIQRARWADIKEARRLDVVARLEADEENWRVENYFHDCIELFFTLPAGVKRKRQRSTTSS